MILVRLWHEGAICSPRTWHHWWRDLSFFHVSNSLPSASLLILVLDESLSPSRRPGDMLIWAAVPASMPLHFCLLRNCMWGKGKGFPLSIIPEDRDLGTLKIGEAELTLHFNWPFSCCYLTCLFSRLQDHEQALRAASLRTCTPALPRNPSPA